jgi:23S rRNA pseudouridine2605 synthase
MPQERLQKILARAGVASRRGAERLITEGRVSVDGRPVTELGARADASRQAIAVDGERLVAEHLVYVLFHKPRKVVCTMHDPEGRETVRDYMTQVAARVVPVGRLDFHTSGVLLLTNDGDLASKLLHPNSRVPKSYVAKVRGVVTDSGLDEWRAPIEIDGSPTQPAEVRRLRVEDDKTWLEITLREGKNRHIHRLGEATGNTVLRLARIRFAGIGHDALRPGSWRYLSRDELLLLKRTYGVPKRVYSAPALPNQQSIRRQRTQTKGPHLKGSVTATPGLRRSRRVPKGRSR